MSMLDALLFEREGYLRRGLTNRVAQVDAQIKALGGVVVADIEAPDVAVTEKAVKRGPRRG